MNVGTSSPGINTDISLLHTSILGEAKGGNFWSRGGDGVGLTNMNLSKKAIKRKIAIKTPVATKPNGTAFTELSKRP
jgi:hypothetical protein